MVHAVGGLLHVDAVQVAGRIPFDINEMDVDLLSISAHKLGGPMGVGALVRRTATPNITEPHIKGGGQERGARAGTENVPGIAGFGVAAAAAMETMAADAGRMRALRDRLEARAQARTGGDLRRSGGTAAQYHACSRFPASRRKSP